MNRLREIPSARIVAGVVTVAFLAYWSSVLFRTDFGLWARSGSTYEVTAIFDQVSGLPKDGEVKAGGVTVGRVREITLGKDNLPRVKLAIEDDFKLRRGATADLLIFGNAGQLNRYILLKQGTGQPLEDGATLATSFTDQPVEFDEVLGALNGQTRADVKSVLAGLDGATTGRSRDFDVARRTAAPAFAQTTALLRALNEDGEALRSAIRDSGTIVQAIAQRPETLGTWTEELRGLLDVTAQRQLQVTQTAQRATAGLREPRLALERLNQALPTLNALIPPARSAIGELPATAAALRPALSAARPTLAEAAVLTRTAPPALRRLTPTLKVLASQLNPARTVLCKGGPVLDTLRAQTPEFTGAVQQFGAITSNYDANGHGARVFLNTARVLGGEATAEKNTSGLLSKPYLRIPGTNIGQPWMEWRESFIGGDGQDCE